MLAHGIIRGILGICQTFQDYHSHTIRILSIIAYRRIIHYPDSYEFSNMGLPKSLSRLFVMSSKFLQLSLSAFQCIIEALLLSSDIIWASLITMVILCY